MNRRRPIWSRRHANEAGFTLIEVIVALVLTGLLVGVGVEGVGIAMRATARTLTEARFDATELLFDRVIRRALTSFPPAYWRRPPQLTRAGGAYRISSPGVARGYSVSLRLAGESDGLLVTYAGTTVLIPGVTKIAVTAVRNGRGDVVGYRFLVSSGRRSQGFVTDYGGLRL